MGKIEAREWDLAMRRKLTIYLAGPLFSEADRLWAKELKKELETKLQAEVIWPYERISDEVLPKLGPRAPGKIFDQCVADLNRCSKSGGVLVAILDGTGVDDGTAWEIGYFYCMQRLQGLESPPIYGIRTDTRRAGETEFSRVNAMIEEACRYLVTSTDEAVASAVAKARTSRMVEVLVQRIHDDLLRIAA